MNLADYSSFDGVALAESVRKREVTPKELAHSFVQAVEKVNPRINAVIEVYPDGICCSLFLCNGKRNFEPLVSPPDVRVGGNKGFITWATKQDAFTYYPEGI